MRLLFLTELLDVDLIYFSFFPYNLGKVALGSVYGNHVGDWEHVTVRCVVENSTRIKVNVQIFCLTLNSPNELIFLIILGESKKHGKILHLKKSAHIPSHMLQMALMECGLI